MLQLPNIKGFFKKITPKKTARGARVLLNPTRDWFVSIVFCALLTFLFVGLSGFIFYQVGRGELFVATPTNALPTKIFDQKLLQEVVSFYRGKAEKFDELKRTKPHFTDPAE